jgi:hypothetical protein
LTTLRSAGAGTEALHGWEAGRLAFFVLFTAQSFARVLIPRMQNRISECTTRDQETNALFHDIPLRKEAPLRVHDLVDTPSSIEVVLKWHRPFSG